MKPSRTLLAAALVTTPLSAQTTWSLRAGGAAVHIVGTTTTTVHAPWPAALQLPAGDYEVRFAVDAAGRPLALAFAVPDGAFVRVAAAPAPAAVAVRVALDAPEWRTSGDVRCVVEARADVLVEAEYEDGAAGAFGVVARWTDERNHYRFIEDREQNELRLERRHGDMVLVLARAPAPAPSPGPHRLALQAVGFRLTALRDDAVVLQSLDGAFAVGGCGTFGGAGVAWRSFSIAPPAASRDSAALVIGDGRADLCVATIAVPGSWHVLELALDRPGPLVPIDAAGLEPWLLVSGGERVLAGDLRGSLGDGAAAEVPPAGTFRTALRWPFLPGLAGRFVMVRTLVVAADGRAVTGASPGVPLVF